MNRGTKNNLIVNQNCSAIKELKYGLCSMGFNGCGVIAVHNALILSGRGSDLLDAADACKACGAMWAWGLFGSKPGKIGKVLKGYGVDCRRVGIGEMTEKGIYIMSYWSKGKFFYSLHTVAMVYDGTTYTAYNHRGGKRTFEPRVYAVIKSLV